MNNEIVVIYCLCDDIVQAIDLLGNNELKLLKQLPRNGFKAFDSESLKPLSRLAFEVF